MGHKRSNEERTLYKRVDEVLYYLWDPIGVAEVVEARDEYDSYVPQVFTLLRQEADASQIAQFLSAIVRDRMGMTPDESRAQRIATILLEYRDRIRAGAS